jgi:CheY-like chemotaxis protein
VVLSHSTLEKGSVFRITLEAEPGESALPSPPERGEASLLATGDKLVLVVDDAKENRMLVNAYLTRLGIKAHMAQNGREGVDMALANDYALVLMDLQMPEMDGFEALRALRKEGYQRPIIAVTAHAMKGDRERCIQVGFDDYLCKPLSKQALADCLANFLS